MVRFHSIFSDTLFQTANNPDFYLENDRGIGSLIEEKLYPSPIYYEGSRSASDLQSFLESPSSSEIKRQIRETIDQIKAWVKAKEIQINPIEVSPGIAAETHLEHFFTTNFHSQVLSDAYIPFYQYGKRFLEIIAVLLEEESIPLEVRKSIMVDMLIEDGLLVCPGGCTSKLQATVNRLEDNLTYQINLNVWFRSFFRTQISDTAAQKPFALNKNYQQLLSLLSDSPIAAYELHAKNFLSEQARVLLGVPVLASHDEFLDRFRGTPGDGKSQLIENYLKALETNITPERLISHFSDKMRDRLTSLSFKGEAYGQSIKKIDDILDQLGDDQGPGSGGMLHEILKSETSVFKTADHFKMTLTERLINKGYFIAPPIIGTARNEMRLFPEAISLSWVFVADQRKPLLTLLKDKSPQELQYFLSSYLKEGYFIDQLVNSPESLATLLEHFSPKVRNLIFKSENHWLSETHLQTLMRDSSTESFNKILTLLAAGDNYQFSESTEVLFLQRCGLEIIKLKVQSRFKELDLQGFWSKFPIKYWQPESDFYRVNEDDHLAIQDEVYLLLDSAMSAGMRDLSHTLISPRFSRYLKGLQFRSGTNLSGSRFGALEGIVFFEVTLDFSTFEGDLTNVLFKESHLKQVEFGHGTKTLHWNDVKFIDHCHLETVTLYPIKMSVQSFMQLHAAGHRDFQHISVEGRIFAHEIPPLYFIDTRLSKQIFFYFYDLGIQDFTGVNLDRIDFSHTLIEYIDCSKAHFREANFEKVIFNSINLMEADLTGANFFEGRFGNVNFRYVNLHAVENLNQVGHLWHSDLRQTGLTRLDLLLKGLTGQRIENAKIEDPTCCIQKFEVQQNLIQKIQSLAQQYAGEIELRYVNQGLALTALEQHHLANKMPGECIALSHAFSESLQYGKTEIFLDNLSTVSALNARQAQDYALSEREIKDLNLFMKSLLGLRVGVNEHASLAPAYRQYMRFDHVDAFKQYLRTLSDDFTFHILLDQHVMVIYRQGNQYGCYDCNTLWTRKGTERLDTLFDFVQQLNSVAYQAGSSWEVERFIKPISEHGPTSNLFVPFVSERTRLVRQTQTLGPLRFQDSRGHWYQAQREFLYDIGLSFYAEGLQRAGRLLDAELGSQWNQETFSQLQSNKKLGLRTNQLLTTLQTRALSFRQDDYRLIFQSIHSIPLQGESRAIQNNLYHLAKSILENHHFPKRAEIHAFIEDMIRARQSPQLMAAVKQNYIHSLQFGSLNALSGLMLTRAVYGTFLQFKEGNISGFLRGVGAIQFGLFSRAIEKGVVRMTPAFIKRTSTGLKVVRGVGISIANLFEIYNLVEALVQIEQSKPGTRARHDAVASAIFSSLSLGIGYFLVYNKATYTTVVGVLIGGSLVLGEATYKGLSFLMEIHDQNIRLSILEQLRVFGAYIILQPVPEDIYFLIERTQQVRGIAQNLLKVLQNSPDAFTAISGGLGQLVKRETLQTKKFCRYYSYESRVPREHFCDEGGEVNASELVIRPVQTEINLAVEKEYRNISRIAYKLLAAPSKISLACLPLAEPNHQFTEIPWISEEKLYYCKNSVVLEDRVRADKIVTRGLMLHTMEWLANNSSIIANSEYDHYFIIDNRAKYLKLIGGANVHNIFSLRQYEPSHQLIGGEAAAYNQMDWSQLPVACVYYNAQKISVGREASECGTADSVKASDILNATSFQSMHATGIHSITGLMNKPDFIYCDESMYVDSQGGSEQFDTLFECHNATLRGNTSVEGSAGLYTFRILPEPSGIIKIKLDSPSIGNLIFQNTTLLSKAHQFIYEPEANKMLIKLANGHFKLKIKPYLDGEIPFFRWIDQSQSSISPLLAFPNVVPSNQTRFKLQNFLVTTTLEKDELSMATLKYHTLVKDIHPDYKLGINLIAAPNNASYFFGHLLNDWVPLTQDVVYVEAPQDQPIRYSLDQVACRQWDRRDRETIIHLNNITAPHTLYVDKALALDWLQLDEAQGLILQFYFLESNPRCRILLQPYLPYSGKFLIQQGQENVRIPWCFPKNEECEYHAIPYYSMEEGLDFILNAENQQGPFAVVIQAAPAEISYMRVAEHLVLVEKNGTKPPFSLQLTSFYTQSLWDTFRIYWLNVENKQDYMSYQKLEALARSAIPSELLLKNLLDQKVQDYYFYAKEGGIKSIIGHNQQNVSTQYKTLPEESQRLGRIIFSHPFSDLYFKASVEQATDLQLEISVRSNPSQQLTLRFLNWDQPAHRVDIFRSWQDQREIDGIAKLNLTEIQDFELEHYLNRAATLQPLLLAKLASFEEIKHPLIQFLNGWHSLEKENVSRCLSLINSELPKGWKISWLFTDEATRTAQLESLAQTVQKISAVRAWIYWIAYAYTLGCEISELKHCFNFISPKYITEVCSIIDGLHPMETLQDWVDENKREIKLQVAAELEKNAHLMNEITSELELLRKECDPKIEDTAGRTCSRQGMPPVGFSAGMMAAPREKRSVLDSREHAPLSDQPTDSNWMLRLGMGGLTFFGGWLAWSARRRYTSARQSSIMPMGVFAALMPQSEAFETVPFAQFQRQIVACDAHVPQVRCASQHQFSLN